MNPSSSSLPRFHLLAGSNADADQYLAKLRFEVGDRIAIRLLRGANMERQEAFYNELEAALQLPLYFGKNWDALDECLADLEWLPADAYLLFFADAPSVLKSAGEKDREIFFQLLVRTCNEWADGSSLDGGLQPAFSEASTRTYETTSASPVAYICVSSNDSGPNNRLVGYATNAKGRLAEISGSPWTDNLSYIATNDKFLFGSTLQAPLTLSCVFMRAVPSFEGQAKEKCLTLDPYPRVDFP